MPLRYLRELTAPERNKRNNFHLGIALCFVAGATNAGGFLAVGQYTSHMTGILSGLADNWVLGNSTLILAAMASILMFMAGAITSTLLINWARRRGSRSLYAEPLMLEALLLLCFGLLGGQLDSHSSKLISLTMLLLCFIMGLQNAIITKISKAVIRTTHLTGLITDISIELGRLFYWNRNPDTPDHIKVLCDRKHLKVQSSLVMAFFCGAVLGAYGFSHLGFSSTIILALILALLSIGPLIDHF
ncbi:YoaK family protein [Janthinobacterium sp. B9-8]|uniref:YoaK family protein n=1 Tax=Janthinobacterium sp. B9-8 TaxID=1236179 RepID=UPI00061D2740|nr:YoaK family protein [Janthinobacterium sp. B9-8]AMC35641.1 hypothetical protein VN23_13950 [Janthinobacterium sp. B9-8]